MFNKHINEIRIERKVMVVDSSPLPDKQSIEKMNQCDNKLRATTITYSFGSS